MKNGQNLSACDGADRAGRWKRLEYNASHTHLRRSEVYMYFNLVLKRWLYTWWASRMRRAIWLCATSRQCWVRAGRYIRVSVLTATASSGQWGENQVFDDMDGVRWKIFNKLKEMLTWSWKNNRAAFSNHSFGFFHSLCAPLRRAKNYTDGNKRFEHGPSEKIVAIELDKFAGLIPEGALSGLAVFDEKSGQELTSQIIFGGERSIQKSWSSSRILNRRNKIFHIKIKGKESESPSHWQMPVLCCARRSCLGKWIGLLSGCTVRHGKRCHNGIDVWNKRSLSDSQKWYKGDELRSRNRILSWSHGEGPIISRRKYSRCRSLLDF